MKLNLKILIIPILLLTISFNGYAQRYTSGKIIDDERNPISSATLLLYNAADSTFSNSTCSDSLGNFRLEHNLKFYKLIIQHDNFEPHIILSSDSILGEIPLTPKTHRLNEVVVTAAPNSMKISSSGALSYNAKLITKSNPIYNALDYLKYIPTIQSSQNGFEVIGGGHTTIILNGKKSNLTQDQIVQYLSSIPAQQVKSIDVSYSTPPQSGVKGASINIVFENKRSDNLAVVGSVNTSGILGYYLSETVGTAISFSKKKWSLDVTYQFNHNKDYSELNLNSFHNINNDLITINHDSRTKSQNNLHNFSILSTFDFNKNNALYVNYIGRISSPISHSTSDINIDNIISNSVDNNLGDINMHNIDLSYKHKDLTAALEYTFYHNKSNEASTYAPSNIYNSNSKQKVNKFNTSINNSHSLFEGKVSYGLNGFYSTTHNDHNISSLGFTNEDKPFHSVQTEYNISGFIGYNYRFGKKGFINVSLRGEYFKSTITLASKKSRLWNKFDLFPSLTLIYRIKNARMLQVALSSDKLYPAYWKTTPSVDYISPYLISEGNPHLKPYNIYRMNLNYILTNKYIFGLFGEVSPNYSTQLLYQKPNELIAIYKYLNFKYSNKIGVMSVIPINWTKFFDSRLTVNAFLMKQKGVLENIAFNREKISGRINLNNTIYLLNKKNLYLQISAWYQLPSIQGLYDVSNLWNASASISWQSLDKRWNVSLEGEDIFNSYILKSKVNYNNQIYNFTNKVYNQTLKLSIKYIFNGYKDKKKNVINTSRFGF